MTFQDQLNSFRVKKALKVALASIICVIINALGDFQYGFFAVINVFILMVMIPETTVEQGIIVFFGSAIGVFVAYLFMSLLTGLKPVYLILMVVWLLFCMYVFSSPRYSFGALQAGLFSSWLMIAAMSDPGGVPSMGIHLILQTALGIVVALAVYFLLWPPRHERLLKQMMSSVFINFSDMVQYFVDEKINLSERRNGANRISLNSFSGLLAQISRAAAATKDTEFPEDMYVKLVARLKNIFLKVEALRETLSDGRFFLSDEDVVSVLTGVFRQLSEHYKDLGRAVEQGVKVDSLSVNFRGDIDYLENRYREMHDKPGMDFDYYSEVTVFGTLIEVIKDIAREVDAIDSCHNMIQSAEAYKEMKLRRISGNPASQRYRDAAGFHLDPVRLRLSIKVVLAIMIVVFGDLYFDLPASVETLITAVLVTAAPANIGQAHLKEKLRFLAVIVGGLYSLGVILIVSQLTHFSVFLLLLWLGLFLGAYTASGSERVSYAGFQMGIVLPLILLGTDGPPTSFTIAVQRFVGVIIGGVIALVIVHFVWPVDPLERLREGLSAALHRSGLVFKTLLRLDRKDEKNVESQVMTVASELPTSAALLKDAHYVIGERDLRSKEYIQVIESLEIIYAELENLRKTIYIDAGSDLINQYISFMSPHYEKIGTVFDRLAERLKAGTNPAAGVDINELSEQVKSGRAEFRESGASLQFSSEDLEKLSLLVTSIDGILSSVAKISEAVAAIGESSPGKQTYKLAGEHES
ncbi:MAG: FUSC family protein [Deltaproteobacteria bacterium]